MAADDASTDPAHQAVQQLLRPIARLALAHGLRLGELVEMLKQAMLDAAQAQDGALSMSQLSVRTGVHRKDVRALLAAPTGRTPRRRSPAVEVFARWLSDGRYLTTRGRPRVLPRQAAADGQPSFDGLVTSVTTDVHPRSVLDELLRLSLAAVDERGRVRLVAAAFVPRRDRAQMLGLLADNVGDHLDAAVDNLLGDGPRFLEQALFSDELSAESAQEFNLATRAAWDAVHALLMPRLQALYERDRSRPARQRRHRVRLGVYGYVAGPPDAAPAAAADDPTGAPDDDAR